MAFMSGLKRSFPKQMRQPAGIRQRMHSQMPSMGRCYRQRTFLAMGSACQAMTCASQPAAATACEPNGNLSRLFFFERQAAVFFS